MQMMQCHSLKMKRKNDGKASLIVLSGWCTLRVVNSSKFRGVMRRMEEELDGERIAKLWKSIHTLVAYWGAYGPRSKRMVQGGQHPWSD